MSTLDLFERTLILTPHFDDETIGCGGLISRLSDEGHKVLVVVVATNKDMYNYSVNRIVSNQERRSECIKALDILGVQSNCLVQLVGFNDGAIHEGSRLSLVTQIDEYIKAFKPTAVLFPYSSHHQDHQSVYKASLAALRTRVSTNFIKLKAMYEYPFINTWSSNINTDSKLYVPLRDRDINRKVKAFKAYVSQLARDERDPLSVQAIHNLAKSRGIEISHEYAEVFYPMSIIIE